ncbi:f-box domain-containing protein [Gigaspora margarita]|uniref:F-box domain-containing protein n=1 Tax=Gigaspora margarita TaxID=4874 RepID=A0A8H4B4V1_GIGMA|nr:f-box domain-containing protein [Gigaspora margarita]
MILPNECLYDIFNKLRTDRKSLFSCLLVNRLWCRIIIPILWSEPGVHFKDKRLVKICLSALNTEEQALLIPFNLILPKNLKPLFEYASNITSVNYYYLNKGIENYYNETYGNRISAIENSLALMFLRSSKNLKHLYFIGNIYNETLFVEKLCKNTSIVSLSFSDCYLKDEALVNIFNKSITLTSLDLTDTPLCSERANVLAKTLCESNTTLTSLSLFNNQLHAEGGKVLAKALCKNTILTSLNLGWNELGNVID